MDCKARVRFRHQEIVCFHDRFVIYVEFHLEGGPLTRKPLTVPVKNQLPVVRLVRKKKKGSTELLLWMMLLLLAGCWVMLCVRYGVRVCPRMWDLYYNTTIHFL